MYQCIASCSRRYQRIMICSEIVDGLLMSPDSMLVLQKLINVWSYTLNH